MHSKSSPKIPKQTSKTSVLSSPLLLLTVPSSYLILETICCVLSSSPECKYNCVVAVSSAGTVCAPILLRPFSDAFNGAAFLLIVQVDWEDTVSGQKQSGGEEDKRPEDDNGREKGKDYDAVYGLEGWKRVKTMAESCNSVKRKIG
ncbi:hypothetical protein L596_019248 [Steinernema carpocapsae]|uniref:Uncharacterized protein n=1 Tax=Steinernema carpocapsae TaxID=34508 RepID=A0A4U5MPY2_STECR|nr:hypothetical protein L596_019248 [Steinernema carpocapsae]